VVIVPMSPQELSLYMDFVRSVHSKPGSPEYSSDFMFQAFMQVRHADKKLPSSALALMIAREASVRWSEGLEQSDWLQFVMVCSTEEPELGSSARVSMALLKHDQEKLALHQEKTVMNGLIDLLREPLDLNQLSHPALEHAVKGYVSAIVSIGGKIINLPIRNSFENLKVVADPLSCEPDALQKSFDVVVKDEKGPMFKVPCQY
jgi:hypothetical protein